MKNKITFWSLFKNYFFNLFFWYKKGFESFIFVFEFFSILLTKKSKYLFNDPLISRWVFNNFYINNIFFFLENFISFLRFFSPLFLNLLSFFLILFVFSGGFELLFNSWYYISWPGPAKSEYLILQGFNFYFSFLTFFFSFLWSSFYYVFLFIYTFITEPFLFILDFLKTPDVEFLLAFAIIFFLSLVFDNLKIFDSWSDSINLNNSVILKNLEKNNALFDNIHVLNILLYLKNNINTLNILIFKLKNFYISSVIIKLFSNKYILKYLNYQKLFQTNILNVISVYFGNFWLFSYLKYYYFLNISSFLITSKNSQYMNHLKNISFLRNFKKNVFFNWFILIHDHWTIK